MRRRVETCPDLQVAVQVASPAKPPESEAGRTGCSGPHLPSFSLYPSAIFSYRRANLEHNVHVIGVMNRSLQMRSLQVPELQLHAKGLALNFPASQLLVTASR